jgi:hypothetical protein
MPGDANRLKMKQSLAIGGVRKAYAGDVAASGQTDDRICGRWCHHLDLQRVR